MIVDYALLALLALLACVFVGRRMWLARWSRRCRRPAPRPPD